MYCYVLEETAVRSLLKPDEVGSDPTLSGREFHFLEAK